MPPRAGLGGEPDKLLARFGGRRYGFGKHDTPRLTLKDDVEAFRIDAGHPPGTRGSVGKGCSVKLDRIGMVLVHVLHDTGLGLQPVSYTHLTLPTTPYV